MSNAITSLDRIRARDRLWIIRRELRVMRERVKGIADPTDSALVDVINDIDRDKWSEATEDIDRLLSLLGIAVKSEEVKA